ncbi:copper homeostasis protein CutC [Devosia sp. H5989]|nr:copper homeostasis protein CutC [Devosia sp. H5989]
MTLLEVCVADPQSLIAAVAGGGQRIELCSALELGGVTPSPGLMRLAAEAPIPVYAIVRPRSGDFVYDAADLDCMYREIDTIREFGLAGVVLGASLGDGRLDAATLDKLVRHAKGLGTTLHRAFDLVPDIAEAVELAVSLKFERILTSGGAPTAPEGTEGLAAAIEAANGRIGIMAGSGLRADNVRALLDRLPLEEVHSSCAVAVPSRGEAAMRLGFAAPTRKQTSAEAVRAFRAAIAAPAL